jgi:hypothetical protein
MDSVDKDFVMVNYPATASSDKHTDTQQPHIEQVVTTATSPQSTDDTSPVIVSSDTAPAAIEGAQTVQSEDENQTSLSPVRVEIISPAAQPEENLESAQRSADSSQEVTGIRNEEGGSDREGGQQETEGESEVVMEGESSDTEGEKPGQASSRAFESLGLLYASSPNIKHNRYGQKLTLKF